MTKIVENGAINLDLIDSKTLKERAKRIQAEFDSLSDDIPHQISRKQRLQAELLQIFGKFYADASHDYWVANSVLELEKSKVKLETEGTGIVKEATAKIATHELELAMIDKKRDMKRWQNAVDTTSKLIDSIKREESVLIMEYYNTGK